jgi:hypothetical protein
MKTAVSLVLLALVFTILALSVYAYVEAWRVIRGSGAYIDRLVNAVFSCVLVLFSVLLVFTAASIVVLLLLLPECDVLGY